MIKEYRYDKKKLYQNCIIHRFYACGYSDFKRYECNEYESIQDRT